MDRMLFYSTNDKSRLASVDVKEALLLGQAPDRGLYLPERFPTIPKEELLSYASMTYAEIAFHVLSRYTAGALQHETLLKLCKDAYTFEIPLEPVNETAQTFILRLDRGPTASFKDFAARIMGDSWALISESGKGLFILVATSGDNLLP